MAGVRRLQLAVATENTIYLSHKNGSGLVWEEKKVYDILIKSGRVLDGSGAEGFLADVAIQDGKIAAVGKALGNARQVLDAAGLVVTPGFIDSHSHADNAVLKFPQQIEKVEQGITTSIGGQCGSTLYPAREDGRIVKIRSAKFPRGQTLPPS